MLDACFDLLVALDKVCFLGNQLLLAFTQRKILFLQAPAQVENLLQAVFEALEFLFEGGFVRHARNYRAARKAGQFSLQCDS